MEHVGHNNQDGMNYEETDDFLRYQLHDLKREVITEQGGHVDAAYHEQAELPETPERPRTTQEDIYGIGLNLTTVREATQNAETSHKSLWGLVA